MTGLACCQWCGRVLDSRTAMRIVRERLATRDVVRTYCDDPCAQADQRALDWRVLDAAGDLIYTL